MLDPIFDLLAGLLAWFYSLIPSYGFAIVALTTLVLVVLSPLTYRSTKSMLAMRRLQPQVRRIQKKHAGDREKMNQEMMALYQEHQVSPMSGCLPILVQSPVFIVMFRVIRGITRRSSTIGFPAGRTGASWNASQELNQTVAIDLGTERRNFNPEYLSENSDMYQDLVQANEMLFLGVDLSRTPLEALGDSIIGGLPYLVMVGIVAALGWYQQRQLAGRATGEISAQQQMIMKIMPWMLPIFSFTMPAGLVLYFMVSSTLRIAQQAYLTRTVYANEELNAPIEVEDDFDDFDDSDSDGTSQSPLAQLFSGPKPEATASARHGSRRPVSANSSPRKRTRPPRDVSGNGSDAKGGATKAESARGNRARGSSRAADTATGWGRAKRSAQTKDETPVKPVSRRVTPKGDARSNPKKK